MTREVAWLKPRQRIFQRDKRRLSIRLEEEFWTQLEHCAKEDNVKLADLIFRLSESHGEDKNRSSVLRSYCVRWLRQKLIESRFLKSDVNLDGILASCPVPCMIIMPDRRISAKNQLFSDKILGALVLEENWDDASAVVRLSLSQPIDQIFTRLVQEDEGYVEADISFSRARDTIQMAGRFCLLNKSRGRASSLLCFLRPVGEE